MTAEIARRVIAYFRPETRTASDVESLSVREREVLEFVARGFTNKEIAARMSVTPETVHWHLKNSFRKLHVHTRTEATMRLRKGAEPPGTAE